MSSAKLQFIFYSSRVKKSIQNKAYLQYFNIYFSHSQRASDKLRQILFFCFDFMSESVIFLKILVIIAADHTVIKASHLVRPFAVNIFKILLRGDDVYLPGRQLCENLSHLFIKRLGTLHSVHSFSVGRIADDGGALVIPSDGKGIFCETVDIIPHSRTADIIPCDLHCVGVDITGDGTEGSIKRSFAVCRLSGILPELFLVSTDSFPRQICDICRGRCLS